VCDGTGGDPAPADTIRAVWQDGVLVVDLSGSQLRNLSGVIGRSRTRTPVAW
jgi:hypothetical protein